MEWQKSGMALRQLKRMLWGLEALRVFRDKLAKATDALKSASKKMEKYVNKRKDLQHKDMRRTAQRITDEFQKRYGHVQNALSAIHQRIEEGTKLEEGVGISRPDPDVQRLTTLRSRRSSPLNRTKTSVCLLGLRSCIFPRRSSW